MNVLYQLFLPISVSSARWTVLRRLPPEMLDSARNHLVPELPSPFPADRHRTQL